MLHGYHSCLTRLGVLFATGRMDMLEVKTFEEVQHIMQLGYEYAARLQGDGQFDHFQTGQFALNPLEDSQLRSSTATKSRDGGDDDSSSSASSSNGSSSSTSTTRPSLPAAAVLPVLSAAAAMKKTSSQEDIKVALESIEEAVTSPASDQQQTQSTGMFTSVQKLLSPVTTVIFGPKKNESRAQ